MCPYVRMHAFCLCVAITGAVVAELSMTPQSLLVLSLSLSDA
jgi:hypothetical protein